MDWEILPVCSSYAVCGTTLFFLGGALKTSSALGEMHFIDLADSSSSRGWKKGPSMRGGRCFPGTVSVDGKIYVFGGLERRRLRRGETQDEPWAEVYDTKEERWRDPVCPDSIEDIYKMGRPPCCLLDCIDGEEELRVKKILVVDKCSKRLFAYDLIQGQWDEDCGKNHKLNNLPSTLVTRLLPSGEMLFITSPTKWWVFDLGSKKHSGLVPGIEQILHDLALKGCRSSCLEEIVCLGCRSRDHHGMIIHRFLLFFRVYFVDSSDDGRSVYVARSAVAQDNANRFSSKLESLGNFLLGEGLCIHHYYATADISSEWPQDDDNGRTFAGEEVTLS